MLGGEWVAVRLIELDEGPRLRHVSVGYTNVLCSDIVYSCTFSNDLFLINSVKTSTLLC